MKVHVADEADVIFIMSHQEALDLLRTLGDVFALLPPLSEAREILGRFGDSVIEELG